MPAALGYRNFYNDTSLATGVTATDSSVGGSSDVAYPATNVLDGKRSTFWRRYNIPSVDSNPAAMAVLDMYCQMVDYSGLLNAPVHSTIGCIPVGLLHLDNVAVMFNTALPTSTAQRMPWAVQVTMSHSAFTNNALYDSGVITMIADQFGARPSIVVPVGFPSGLTDGQKADRYMYGGYKAVGAAANKNLYIRIKIWCPTSLPLSTAPYSVHVGSVRLSTALVFDVSESGFVPGLQDNTRVIRTDGQTAVPNIKTPARTIAGTMTGLKDDRVMGPYSTITKVNRETGISQPVFFTPDLYMGGDPNIWSHTKAQSLYGLFLLDSPLRPATTARSDDKQNLSVDGTNGGFAWTCPFSMTEMVDA